MSASRASYSGGSGGGQPRGDGEVTYNILGTVFRVDTRYKDLKAIGKGSYGIVCSALDQRQGKKVAIKKITPMAQHAVDAKHVLREIRLMRYLGVHPNIISLEDVFVREYSDELYIVMELLDSDLHRIIQSSQSLSDAHHRYFMYQLLRGVRFLHHNRIIHRDLKPGNLLVTKNCQLRITDFGLARSRPMGRGDDPDDMVDDPMTEHVVTRWYRPPELMLCPDGLYTYAVDMWSVGCIFAELIGREPLFPGKNFVDQLTLIFDKIGSPMQEEVVHIKNSQARKFLDSMAGRPPIPCEEMFPQASPQAMDLLANLLVFEPTRRLNVNEALAHPYFDPLKSTENQPDPEVAEGFEFDFETEPLKRLQLKQLILQEVDEFRQDQRRKEKLSMGRSGIIGSGGGGGGGYPSGAPRSSRTSFASADGSEPRRVPANEMATVKAGNSRRGNSWRGGPSCGGGVYTAEMDMAEDGAITPLTPETLAEHARYDDDRDGDDMLPEQPTSDSQEDGEPYQDDQEAYQGGGKRVYDHELGDYVYSKDAGGGRQYDDMGMQGPPGGGRDTVAASIQNVEARRKAARAVAGLQRGGDSMDESPVPMPALGRGQDARDTRDLRDLDDRMYRLQMERARGGSAKSDASGVR